MDQYHPADFAVVRREENSPSALMAALTSVSNRAEPRVAYTCTLSSAMPASFRIEGKVSRFLSPVRYSSFFPLPVPFLVHLRHPVFVSWVQNSMTNSHV